MQPGDLSIVNSIHYCSIVQNSFILFCFPESPCILVSPSPEAMENTDLFTIPRVLPFSRKCYSRTHAIGRIFTLVIFCFVTYEFKFSLDIVKNSSSFLLFFNTIPLSRRGHLVISSFTQDHLICFQVLAIMKKASKNTSAQVCG